MKMEEQSFRSRLLYIGIVVLALGVRLVRKVSITMYDRHGHNRYLV